MSITCETLTLPSIRAIYKSLKVSGMKHRLSLVRALGAIKACFHRNLFVSRGEEAISNRKLKWKEI